MSDLISRQAAIDALRSMQTYKLFEGHDLLLIDQAAAMTEMMLLPSADVQQKEGEKKTESEFTLNNPLTEEDWDKICDVDMDNINKVTFCTKHSKEVEFVKIVRCEDCLIHGLCRFEQGLGLDGFCSKGEMCDYGKQRACVELICTGWELKDDKQDG